jgi:murein DD-endopeptidase MepM/ murein hydrolase activator NlpD
MSAEDFNQGYKRLKYLQQGARFRRRQAEIISEIVQEVSDSKARLEGDMAKLSDLRGREESQKQLLEQEQKKKQNLVRELTGKEKKLQQDLQEKKKIATRIQSEINKIIEEEKKKAVKSDMTPEQKLAGADFAGNKGLLPWPVERGVVTSTFGKHTHPDFKNIVEDNDGIDITSVGNTPVRSIFRGEVVRVFSIPGANMAVIIRHGRYLTVYQGIVNVRVKAGNKVETKQTIGDLYIEPDSGNKGVLNFMIYDEGVKLNPEIWIAPKK